MLKALIANKVAKLKVKKLWNHISSSPQKGLIHPKFSTVIDHFLEWKQKDRMAKRVPKKPAILEINDYSDQ